MMGDGSTTTSSPTKLAVGGGPPPLGAGGPASSSMGENGKEKQKEACVSCRVTKVRSLSTAKMGGGTVTQLALDPLFWPVPPAAPIRRSTDLPDTPHTLPVSACTPGQMPRRLGRG